MNNRGIYFILFLNCVVFNIRTSVSKVGDGGADSSKFIDYEKAALDKLSINTASGSTVNWREAFLKLAPIAINAIDQAKKSEDLAKKSDDLAKKSDDLAKKNEDLAKQNSIDAGRYHFILLSRNKFVFDEDHYCIGMPENDDEFRRKIKEDTRFSNIPNENISCKKHAKKWLWMLVKGDSYIFNNLDNIRASLEHNAQRYLWFVTQIQGIFDVLNDDAHSPASSLLGPKHVNLENIAIYLTYLNTQVQHAMKIYYESDGHVVKLN